MSTLQTLRQAKFLARFVLAWFVLSLGVAIASPMVNPNGAQLICSGASVKLVNADGDETASAHTLDCPLCGSGAVPLLDLNQSVAFSSPLSQSLSRDTAAQIAAATAAPLSARAPPFSL
jgi:hypothetical protein